MATLASHLAPSKIVFYVLFWGFHWGLFAIGWWKQASDPRLAGLNSLTFSVWFSRGAGLVLSVDILMILLPMCRNLMRFIRPKFKWLPLDETQWFHRQVAYALLTFTIVHVTAHYVNFFNVEKSQIRPQTAIQIHYTQPGGITGHIMLLCMLLMYTTAHHKIRQQSFETFWYTHHLFIPFLLAMYTHAVGCFVRDTADPFSPFAGKLFWTHCIGYEGWRWELFGGGLYLIERLYREIRARRDTKIYKVIRHPYDAMEIQFQKPSMKYKAGQWLFINVPGVSSQQWHPFTITSCPFDPYISIHVRQVGDWTKSLGDALGCGPAQAKEFGDLDSNGIYEIALKSGQEMPAIRIDGPYGAPAEDVFDNEIAVLIGTGIGVTPWASVLKHIYNIRAGPNPPRRLKRVEFLWVTRSIESFEWFQTLLSSLEEQSAAAAQSVGGPEFLRIHTYLTQKVDANTAANIYLNTVGNAVDPLTELRTKTQYGRPDFKRLFGAMRDGLMDQTYMDVGKEASLTAQMKATVGVYFCGPGAAAREIKDACSFTSNDLVKFRFWKEHF
ncbi:NADPH oxidase [Exophiala viscosa]|uniref:NADPH oxidase n=1 Tax=Exophiala viscosa TaxID=2486360 RepID=A0AAN6DQ35_9EURO|nr:NADPH oxidase [Exophiala viscosa]KAI1620542.1 NADPH oxidase [Exophiala viscosa]